MPFFVSLNKEVEAEEDNRVVGKLDLTQDMTRLHHP